MSKMKSIKKLSPGRLISLGFAAVILCGAVTLTTPWALNEGQSVSFVNALFTSTSAVCVTGLNVVDTANTYSVFGRIIIALLIQTGGLGVTSVGVGFVIAARRRVNFKERLLVKEALNIDTFKGIVKLVKSVLLVTLCFEVLGMILSFIVFVQDYPPLKALGISAFHSISAFNNAGFDVLGDFKNLTEYSDNVLLNLVTCGLIIFGGLGFLVIVDIVKKRSFRKLNLHSKVVIVMTASLLSVGTILLLLTEKISVLGAFFNSTSARTAGFTTYQLSSFTVPGLLVLTALMFIGASPGSTGGGIKTTTFFSLLQAAKSVATNSQCTAFKRKIPTEILTKSFVLTLFSAMVVCIGTFLIAIFEPDISLMDVLFEETSAFGTVGLSTGITPGLSIPSKLTLILTMFIGRLGPVTIASLWIYKPQTSISYSEENIAIG